MSFPAYPDYKHSGVELLPEYPSHWTLKRFKNVFAERAERSSDGSEELLSVSAYFGVKPRSETLDEGDHLSRAESLEGYKVCRAGDLVINIMLAWNRGLGFSWQHGIVSPAYSVFHVTDGSLPKFLDYLVRSDECIRYFKTHSAGIMDSRLRLYPESFGRLFSAIPPACEQTQIARFLDHETARIDALIEEQQRLIELLKEKRQAVISHAVTKGLNSTVPMKDSGVEWLGKVPAHWDVLPVWMLFQMGRGRVISHDEIAENSGDYPVYSSQTERDGVMGSIDTYDFEGDYLTWTTDGANAGTVFRRSGKFNCTNVCGTLLPKRKDDDLRYFVDAVGICTAAFIRHDINPKLMNNVMASIKVPVPPLMEQTAIAAYVSAFKDKETVLIQEAFTGISLLQERRSALISAAVTGKIDVRAWQPPASTQTPEFEVAEAH